MTRAHGRCAAAAVDVINPDQAASAGLRKVARRRLLGYALAWTVTSVAHAQSTTIPLCTGLQIVTAVNQSIGDYESIKTVESADATGVRIKYSAEQLVTDFLAADFGSTRRNTSYRSLRRSDLQSAVLYQQRFFDDLSESVPGTTAIGVSAAVLRSLKTTGRAELGISTAYSGEFPADRDESPNLYDFMPTAQLTRVGAKPTMLPVVVNGVSVELPAIQARGEFSGEVSEFLFLDDESNPLTLRFRIGVDAVAPMNKEMKELCQTMQTAAPEMTKALCGNADASDRESLQVVKISHRCGVPAAPQTPQPANGAAQLEQELASSGKAVIYDIHFSFNSDRIRDESQPRLAEIATVLRKHPDWTLAVTGHTDAIGAANYNLDLSKRRAAAVKQALNERHGIAATRLTTAGYGAGQPRDTNETLQGRARNRRVELIKQ